MLSHGDLVCLCQRHKFIDAKGQGHTGIMHVYDTLSHGDTLMCQIWYEHDKRKKKSCGRNNKLCQKTYKLDLD